MEEGELIYLAGLFDGEGSFSIQVGIREYKGVKNVRFNYRMTLTLKDGAEEPMRLLRKHFGGQVYEYGEGREKTCRWNLSRRDGLLKACNKIMPHLRVKKEIGENFLRALNIMPEKRKNHKQGKRSWSKEMALEVAKIAIPLNPYRKSKKDLSYLKEIEKVYDETKNK